MPAVEPAHQPGLARLAGVNRDEFLGLLDGINTWKRRGERAPHKPLLLLLALARLQRGESRIAAYESDVREPLRRLLIDFGPPRRAHKPENPFWYLRSDELWEIPDEELAAIRGRGPKGGPSDRLLRDVNAHGGFPEPIHRLLEANPQLAAEAGRRLLQSHFPETLHEPILNGVGLSVGEGDAAARAEGLADDDDVAAKRPRRDPHFRRRVLTAYERRCAICDFDMRLEDTLVALDAAHIRWHAHGGPDEVPNGLALCTFHHVTFDRGAIGLEPADQGFRILVSDIVHGQSDSVRRLLRHHSRPLRPLQRSSQRPGRDFVDWHRREVFRGSPRDTGDSRQP